MENRYQLKAVLSSEFRPVKYRIRGKEHYQVFLSIESKEFDVNLEKVAFVEYELHNSFKEKFRISKERGNNFEIEIRTWGTFIVKTTVNLKNGESEKFSINYKDVLIKK